MYEEGDEGYRRALRLRFTFFLLLILWYWKVRYFLTCNSDLFLSVWIKEKASCLSSLGSCQFSLLSYQMYCFTLWSWFYTSLTFPPVSFTCFTSIIPISDYIELIIFCIYFQLYAPKKALLPFIHILQVSICLIKIIERAILFNSFHRWGNWDL